MDSGAALSPVNLVALRIHTTRGMNALPVIPTSQEALKPLFFE